MKVENKENSVPRRSPAGLKSNDYRAKLWAQYYSMRKRAAQGEEIVHKKLVI